MKVAIIDDEAYFREKEKVLLINDNKDYEITTYSSTTAFMASGRIFDLLLLDIEMPNDDGIAFVRKNRDRLPYVIFVTSHEELVYDAFQINVLGFVVKSRMDKDFVEKVRDVQMFIESETPFKFRTKTGSITIRNKFIYYFYVDYETYYVVTDKRTCIYIRSFKEIPEDLLNNFFQINRKELVNLHNVEHIFNDTHTIEMKNGAILRVSDRKWKTFKMAYAKVIGYD